MCFVGGRCFSPQTSARQRLNPSTDSLALVLWYHGGENDYLNNSKIILICNRTNTRLPGKLNSFRVGNGNFENSKLFEGLVILRKNKDLTSAHTHTTHFILIFSCLFFRVAFSCLSSFISSSLSLSLSVCLFSCVVVSFCPLCLSVSVCCGVCACWCVWCVVWQAEKTLRV